MNIVTRQNTPASAQDCVSALEQAWPNTAGILTQQVAALLLALCFTETGSGQSMQNNSPGNITANDKWSGDAWRPPWFEEQPASPPPGQSEATWKRYVDLHALMLKGQAPSAFRAYSTLAEGFEDYVRVLNSQFPEVITAARTGDAETFRVALSKKYSGDYKNTKTTATFQQLQQKFLPMLSSLPPEPVRPAAGTPLSPGDQSSSLAEPSSSEPYISLGSQGALVGDWQRFLQIKDDEDFGPETDKASKAFQQSHGVIPSGKIPVSWVNELGVQKQN